MDLEGFYSLKPELPSLGSAFLTLGFAWDRTPQDRVESYARSTPCVPECGPTASWAKQSKSWDASGVEVDHVVIVRPSCERGELNSGTQGLKDARAQEDRERMGHFSQRKFRCGSGWLRQ